MKTLKINETDEVVITGEKVISFTMKQRGKLFSLGKLVNGVFYVKRLRSKHLFRRLKSYGFCEVLIRWMSDDVVVQITDETGVYKVPILAIKTGDKDIIKPEGYEEQVFLPIEVMEHYKVNPEG